MELYKLRSFVAVAEENSITRAAERLYTTPPSVSAHIKALEEELGVVLFERTAKGMTLTPRGGVLLDKAQRVLQATRDLVNHATEMQDVLMGTLALGVNATPAFLRIPSVLNRLQSEAPGIELELTASSTGHILPALQSQTLDAGFVFGPVADNGPVMTYFLDTVTLAVAAPARWQGRTTGASWSELAELPWIDSGPDCPFQAVIDDLFDERGLEYKRAAATSDEATRRDLVAAGTGLSLVLRGEVAPDAPNQRTPATNDSEAIALVDLASTDSEPITAPLSIAHHETRSRDPLIEALVDAIVATWSS